MITLKQFLQLAHAQYAQSRIAGDAAFRKSQLTAEVLAAPDDDDDDPFSISDDDEDELEANELTVYCTERHVIHVFGQGLSNCIAQCNCTRPRLVFTLV